MALFRCAYKGCIFEIGASEDRAVNRRAFKAGALQVGICEIASLDVGTFEDGSFQIRAPEAGGDKAAAKVSAY